MKIQSVLKETNLRSISAGDEVAALVVNGLIAVLEGGEGDGLIGFHPRYSEELKRYPLEDKVDLFFDSIPR